MKRALFKIRNRDLIDRQCTVPVAIEYIDGRVIPAGAICEIVKTWQGKFILAWTQRSGNHITTTYTHWVRRGVFCLLAPNDERPEARRWRYHEDHPARFKRTV